MHTDMSGIILLVFYILIFIVLGHSFNSKGNTQNKLLLLVLRIFAFIVLITSIISIFYLFIAGSFFSSSIRITNKDNHPVVMTTPLMVILFMSLLPFVFIPIVTSALVAFNKEFQPNIRKVIISLVWLNISLWIFLLIGAILSVSFIKYMNMVSTTPVQIHRKISMKKKKKS